MFCENKGRSQTNIKSSNILWINAAARGCWILDWPNFRTIRSRLTRLEELEAIREGDTINSYSKKMQSALGREYRKMFRNLNGLRTMNRLPECAPFAVTSPAS